MATTALSGQSDRSSIQRSPGRLRADPAFRALLTILAALIVALIVFFLMFVVTH